MLFLEGPFGASLLSALSLTCYVLLWLVCCGGYLAWRAVLAVFLCVIASQWRGDADGDAGDFLNMEQYAGSAVQNATGDNMFMLYLEPENAVGNGDMVYNPMEGDMDNVNLMLDDTTTAPAVFTTAEGQNNSNWTQLDQLSPMFDSPNNAAIQFSNGESCSNASNSNNVQQDWNGPSIYPKTEATKDEVQEARSMVMEEGVEGLDASSPSNSTLKRKKSGKGSSTGGTGVSGAGKSKSSVPTAQCRLCKKETATNGANFKRHEVACMRQKGMLPPSVTSFPSATTGQEENAGQIPTNDAGSSGTVKEPSNQKKNGASIATTQMVPISTELSQRTDQDLSSRIRRLENVISTIDSSARISLRDSLISLSNKAANPNIPRTPEQEEMNRAAEYLVLRMLFLSEPQVSNRRPTETSEPH